MKQYEPIDITELHREWIKKGFTPSTMLEKFDKVEPISKEIFEKLHLTFSFNYIGMEPE